MAKEGRVSENIDKGLGETMAEIPPIAATYRPDKKWGVTDEEWECWMVEMLVHYPAYQYEYNQFIISKIKSDCLASIVPPEEISKSKAHRKAGSWVRKSGINPDDRRPDYTKSLTTYGDLFFGSPFGYHKEFDTKKGRRWGMHGSFTILWDLDVYCNKGKHPRCPRAGNQFFYNGLAVCYALVEEAERRGDYVTFTLTPGDAERNMPWHSEERYRRAPSGKIKVAWPSTEDPKTGKPAVTDFTDAFRQLMGVGIPGIVDPPEDGYLSKKWWKDMFTGLGRDGADLGGIHQGELSKYYWWMNTQDYDDIKEELLNFAWHGHSIPTYIGIVLPLIQRLLGNYGDKKGTLVIVTPMTQVPYFLFGVDYFESMSRQYNMYIFDIGEKDWTMMFRMEPHLRDRAGNPYFNYISINTLFKISLSPAGLIGYTGLRMTNQKGGLTIELNGITRRFPYKDFPTAAALERAITSTFPTLTVERTTAGHYKMRESDAVSRELSTPDGVLIIKGYDLENLTYKILKVIGGMIDGVLVT